MDEKLFIAIVSAGSAIFGTVVTQIISYLVQKNIEKKKDLKEYRNERIKSYSNIYEIIIQMYEDQVKIKDPIIWAGKIVTLIEKMIVKQGIWIDSDDISLLKKFQKKVSDLSANEIMLTSANRKEYLEYKEKFPERFKSSLSEIKNSILTNTRKKVRKLYGL